MKRFLKITGLMILVIIGALAAIPAFFGDEIREAILKEVNKDLEGELSMGEVSLSLLKSFPDLRVDISDVKLRSDIDTSQNLLTCSNLYLDLDVMSVLRKTEAVRINGVHLRSPEVFISFNENGRGNYDIMPTNDAAGETSSATYAVDIRDYSVKEGKFMYNDPKAGTLVSLEGLDHMGGAQLNGDHLDWTTTTEVKSLSVASGGQTLLKKAKITSVLDCVYDMGKGSLLLKENTIGLNDLSLMATGGLDFLEEGIEMDMAIETPDNQLSSLWSVLPSQTRASVGDVKAEGSFDVSGKAKGLFNSEGGSFPDLDLGMSINKGSVSYSQLPQSLRDIDINARYVSKQNGNDVIIDIDQLAFKAGKSAVDAVLHIEPEAGDVKVDGSGKVDLDLSDLPLGDGYSGEIDMDVTFNGRQSDIVAKRYNKINLNGKGAITDLRIADEGLPEVRVNSPLLVFSPSAVVSDDLTVMVEDSDFKGKARIENPLGFAVSGISPKVIVNSSTERLDVNKIMSKLGSGQENTKSEPSPGGPVLPFDMVFEWAGTINDLIYEDYEVSTIKGGLTLDGKNLSLLPSSMTYMRSPLEVSGELNDLDQYLSDAGPINGTINIQGDELDLNSFMSSEEGSSSGEESGPIVLPANMDLIINPKLGMVKYEEIVLNDVNGQVNLHDQALDLRDVTAGYLGGKMKLEGQFLSNGVEEPAFNFKYDVIRLPFEGLVEQVKWIDQIMPLSHYIKGIFNSTFLFEGKLGQDMMPQLGSLSVSGYIETLEAALGALPFMEKLSKKISVKELQGLALENTKNWFEIKDGKFYIQPFETNYKDIKLEIGGYTGLDKTMDFEISADIPKELFDQLPGGNQLNEGVQWLTDEVSKRGIPFGEIKSYKLGIDLSGNVKDPDVKVKLLDLSKGSIKESLDIKKEELKKEVEEKIEEKKEEIKEEVEEKIEEKKEELRDTVNKRIEEEKQRLLDKAKEEAEKKVDSTLLKEAEKVIGKEKINELKDKLNKFDPFKKKKN
jgi:hypothetical protein